MPSDLEQELYNQIQYASLPLPDVEYKFCPTRKWRADFAWVKSKLIVEVEGGVWTRGRHVRGRGYLLDIEKYNTAVLLGWRVLRVAGDHIKSGEALDWIEEALGL